MMAGVLSQSQGPTGREPLGTNRSALSQHVQDTFALNAISMALSGQRTVQTVDLPASLLLRQNQTFCSLNHRATSTSCSRRDVTNALRACSCKLLHAGCTSFAQPPKPTEEQVTPVWCVAVYSLGVFALSWRYGSSPGHSNHPSQQDNALYGPDICNCSSPNLQNLGDR